MLSWMPGASDCSSLCFQSSSRSAFRQDTGYSSVAGGVPSLCVAIVYDHRPSHPYYAGTEHVEFALTRRTLLALSAKRREVLASRTKDRSLLGPFVAAARGRSREVPASSYTILQT